MTFSLRAALAAACAAGLATPVAALAVPTTVRVEGTTQTLIAPTQVDVPESGSRTVVDDLDADSIAVPERSATAQLDRAADDAGVPISFDLFDFGSGPSSFITGIGADRAPADFSSFWRLKVNHVSSAVGADEVELASGDEVLWSLGTFSDPELDVAVPSDPVSAGASFTVTVVQYDNDGGATPAAAATVTYGSASATTDASGSASLVGTGEGTQQVQATLAGAVRDAASICSHPADRPEVCDPSAVPSTPSAKSGATPTPSAAPTGVACRPFPERTGGGGDPSRVVASPRVYLRVQRYAQTVIRRVAAIEDWIDAGIVAGDICGGAIGADRFGAGVTLAAGGGVASTTAPSPRPLEIAPLAARARARRAAGSPGLARATRRIVLTAMSRTIALERRLDGGLGGADVVDGSIGNGHLRAGLRVSSAGSGEGSSPKPVTRARIAVGSVRPSDAGARTDMRVAVAAIRRSADLVDRARAGLIGDQFAPGSLGPADLSPEARP